MKTVTISYCHPDSLKIAVDLLTQFGGCDITASAGNTVLSALEDKKIEGLRNAVDAVNCQVEPAEVFVVG